MDQQSIDAKVQELQEIKTKLIPANRLRNIGHLNAQIEVLKGGLSEDRVYDRFGEDELGDDFDDALLDAALEASRWLEGKYTTLAEDWKILATDYQKK